MNIKVQEFKINNLTFRLDFNALIKFEERYGLEGIKAFNEFLQGRDTYKNIVKILSCCCVEKDLTEEELQGMLAFNFNTMKLVDEITVALVEGVFAEEKGTSKGKNEKTNQGK